MPVPLLVIGKALATTALRGSLRKNAPKVFKALKNKVKDLKMEDVKRFVKSKTADRMAGKSLKLDKSDGPASLKTYRKVMDKFSKETKKIKKPKVTTPKTTTKKPGTSLIVAKKKPGTSLIVAKKKPGTNVAKIQKVGTGKKLANKRKLNTFGVGKTATTVGAGAGLMALGQKDNETPKTTTTTKKPVSPKKPVTPKKDAKPQVSKKVIPSSKRSKYEVAPGGISARLQKEKKKKGNRRVYEGLDPGMKVGLRMSGGGRTKRVKRRYV
tara:strand:- start:486 stop:1289 length:804 start_codon:yes stop_codon:yes gene_type:complete